MADKDIKAVIIDQIEAYGHEGATLTDATVISDVVDDDSTLSSSKNVILRNLQWTLKRDAKKNKTEEKKVPKGWFSLTIGELATRLTIILLLLTLLTNPTQSQVQDGGLQLSVGAIKTDAKNAAIGIGITYFRSIDSILKSKDLFAANSKSYFYVSPSIDIQTGTADAFSSVNVKATGVLASFKTRTVGGYETPDTRKAIMMFPFSVGMESDNTFQRINGLAEVGFVPYYQSNKANIPDALKHTRFGVFMQAGHKFYSDATKDDQILRAKGSFAIDTKKLLNVQGLNVGLIGSADGWYDFLNQKTYYKIVGAARVYLSDRNFFDLLYQKGSGAPNFFQGDQYGGALKINF